MRIAIWHNLPSGGGKRALQHQVMGLVKRGNHVKIWTTPTSVQTFADLRPYAQEVVVPLEEDRSLHGWRYKGRQASANMLNRIASMVEHCRACAAQIDAGGFDVLMGHPCGWFRATPIATVCKLPSLMYLQEPYRSLYEAQPQLPWVAPALEVPRIWPPRNLLRSARDWDQTYALRLQVRAELEWMRRFDAIGVNSLFSRESVMRAYALESTMLKLGIDIELFKPGSSPKQAYVVGLGSITLAKGVDRAIEAIAAIPEAIRPPLVWIGNIGNADFEAEMQRRAHGAGVSLAIRLMVDDTEMVRVISEAACMIYAPRLEPFGLAPLEACACGTPVVAIAEGGVRETIVDGKNGRVVSYFDPFALGKAVSSFTNDLEHATAMGVKARTYVLENWQCDLMDAPLEAALDECRSRKR